MKKVLPLLLGSAPLFSLTACSAGSKPDGKGKEDQNQ